MEDFATIRDVRNTKFKIDEWFNVTSIFSEDFKEPNLSRRLSGEADGALNIFQLQ